MKTMHVATCRCGAALRWWGTGEEWAMHERRWRQHHGCPFAKAA